MMYLQVLPPGIKILHIYMIQKYPKHLTSINQNWRKAQFSHFHCVKLCEEPQPCSTKLGVGIHSENIILILKTQMKKLLQSSIYLSLYSVYTDM